MIIGIDGRSLENQRTGAGRYLFNLLQQWKDIAPKDRVYFIIYFKDNIPNDLPKRDHFRMKILQSPFHLKSNLLFTHYLLPKAAMKDKIDILFCPAYIAPVFYQGEIALTLHDIIYEARPSEYSWSSYFDKIFLKWVSKKSARKASIIFTVSNFSQQEIIKYYQAPKNKIFKTYLGVDPNFYPLNKKRAFERIKDKYGLKKQFILYVGSIFNRRHLPEIIQAFYELAPKIPDYQFLIIGKNHTKPKINIDSLIESINNRLKRKAILRIDYVKNDLNYIYNAADLFIWISDYEGFGLPPLEAMACGIPVITSNYPPTREIFDQAVLIVNNITDIKQIKKAIWLLLTNQKLRKKLINKGLSRSKNFSWSNCAKKTLEILIKSKNISL